MPPYQGVIRATRVLAERSENGNNTDSNSLSFSGDSSQGARKGTMAATDCWMSEIHSQLENSIITTPREIQCMGGRCESPLTISSIKANPTASIALEPIQRAMMRNIRIRIFDIEGFCSSMVCPPANDTDALCSLTKCNMAKQPMATITTRYDVTSIPTGLHSAISRTLRYGSSERVPSPSATNAWTDAQTPFARVTIVAWKASAPEMIPIAGAAAIAFEPDWALT